MGDDAAHPGPRGAVEPPVAVGRAKPIGRVEHQLTHRRYEFVVRRCDATGDDAPDLSAPHAWVTLEELEAYPLPKPHVTVAQVLREAEAAGRDPRGS